MSKKSSKEEKYRKAKKKADMQGELHPKGKNTGKTYEEQKRKKQIEKKQKRKELEELKEQVIKGNKRMREYIDKRVEEIDKKELIQFESIGELAEHLEKELKEGSKRISDKRINKNTVYSRLLKRRKRNKEFKRKMDLIKEPKERRKLKVFSTPKNIWRTMKEEDKKLVNEMKSSFNLNEEEAIKIFQESRVKEKPITQILKKKLK